jgi:hypothetical protein
MAARSRDAAAGRSPFPVALRRAAALTVGFVVVVASLFAGVGAWQSGDAVAAPAPAPAPVPPSAPVTPPPAPPAADDDAPGEDATDEDEPDEDAADQPPPAPAPAPAPTGPSPADVTIQLLDAVRDDGGAAVGRARTTLRSAGFRITATNTVAAARAGNYARTTVLYTSGNEAAGRAVAAALGVTEVRAVTPENNLSNSVMVHVVVKG